MDLGYFEKNKIFFTADPHYDHSNVIKYCNRPFKDIQEMNDTLINNWNSVVGNDDTVFIGGDMGFLKGKHRLKEILYDLKGNKILITGNHDYQNKIHNMGGNFKGIYDTVHFRVRDKELEDKMMKIVINHFPFAHWFRGYVHLHGHIHTGNSSIGHEKVDFMPTRYDIGVDNNNFIPISYEDLKIIITKQMLK